MILITGDKGLIGSKLANRLNEPFIGIDLKDGWNLLDCPLAGKIDLIYHLAAQTEVEKSWKDPFTDSLNFSMTVRLAQAYPQARIIYANSCASLEASSPYGFSKKVAGDYLKKFHKDYVNCIFPNIYGGTKSVVDLFNGKDQVTVYGDGEQVRDYVHVDDIVEGLLKAQEWPVGEYFMGSGVGTTVNKLAARKKIITAPARKEMREVIVPNSTPNWKPLINVMDYIR